MLWVPMGRIARRPYVAPRKRLPSTPGPRTPRGAALPHVCPTVRSPASACGSYIDVLSDRDGVSLCRSLRRQKVTIPILMLSAPTSTEHKISCFDAGADDYLTKPFQLDELLARLRSLLRRSQAVEGAVLRSGDLVMNLLERQVTLGEDTVKLPAKEFELLEYMMRNPRRLLTRAMISESVWNMNYEPCSNVIDVYVSSLRRKVDRDPAHRRIETVIGSGYRFLDHAEGQAAPEPTAPVR